MARTKLQVGGDGAQPCRCPPGRRSGVHSQRRTRAERERGTPVLGVPTGVAWLRARPHQSQRGAAVWMVGGSCGTGEGPG